MSSLVLSKLDYCNSLLFGSPKKILQKLEKVQNAAAKIVFCAKKFDHVSPLLRKLHWLPIPYRIEYKIATLCFKYFTDSNFPIYLSELLTVYTPNRKLRSSNDSRLLLPKQSKKKLLGVVLLTFVLLTSGTHYLIHFDIRHHLLNLRKISRHFCFAKLFLKHYHIY